MISFKNSSLASEEIEYPDKKNIPTQLLIFFLYRATKNKTSSKILTFLLFQHSNKPIHTYDVIDKVKA